MSDQQIQTTCCVVGAGPAGVMVSYLLAQRGIDVLLLEAQHDFDRDFRGDTIHSGIMELLDEMGLADGLQELPHAKMESVGLTMNGVTQRTIDFSELNTKFPYVTMMPQSEFLAFVVERAKKIDSFQIRMGAIAKEVLEIENRHRLEFKDDSGHGTVNADLIIACDGRNSRIRRSLNLQPKKSSVPMDVIWFRVPRNADDDVEPGGHVGSGHLLIVLERTEEWQIGYVFTHGTFSQVKSQGIDWLKNQIANTLPAVSESMSSIQQWKDVAVLKVESNCLSKWYDKNILLIGDAAHVMSPVGGVGINYAIQDAIVAAGIVGDPLLEKRLSERDLARVQRKRKWAIWLIQAFQNQLQRRIVSAALSESTSFRMPWFMRFRFIRRLFAKFISYGVFKVKVHPENKL